MYPLPSISSFTQGAIPSTSAHRWWLFRAAGFALLCFAAALLSMSARPAFAQTTSSSISGTVTDPSGAVVPNAKITVENQATGRTTTQTTNNQGAYTFTDVQPGIYTVSAAAPGFQRQVRTNTEVDANIGRKVSFVMTVGVATTSVTVQANANALQTQTATVGQLVTGREVQSIQLNGGNPMYLSQLEPGVTRHAPLTSFNFAPDFSGPQVNGARNDSILITFDGAPMMRTRANGTTTGVATRDSIAQVQILSTTYPAKFGGTDGGIIQMVTRSGTSHFHGDVYEHLRNSFLDANTWVRGQSSNPAIADHPEPFRFNQFGWNLNGPVAIPHVFNKLRDKLFFLAGQEFLRYRQTVTQTGIVPTALMREGNFSQLLQPNIFMSPVQLKDPQTGQPYPNNVITSGLSANGLALLNAFPLPNANTASFNWEDQAPHPQNQRKDTVTVDYLPTQSQQFHFAFLHYTYFQNNPFSGGFAELPQIWHWPDEDAVLHYTWTINPTTVNDFTASVTSDHVTITNDLTSGLWNRTKYGINYPYLFPASEKLIPDKIPTVEIQDFSTIDGGPYPSHSGGYVTNFADDFTKVIGNHLLDVGGLYMYSGENDFDQIDVSDTTPGATNNQNGQFIFTALHNNQPSTGAGIANAALGLFDSYGEIGQKSYTLFRANSAEFYAQDTWHAAPNLVIEYGIRYSIFQPYFAKWRNQSMFNAKYYDPADAPVVNPITGTESGGNPLDGVVIPGSGFPSSAKGHVPASVLSGKYDDLFRGTSKSYSPIVWSDIQPRFGLSYQIGPGTVFRLGAGRFVQRLAVTDTVQLGGNAPFQSAESVTNGHVDDPGGNGGEQFPLQLSSQAYNLPSPEAWAWSASVEQQLPKLANLTLSYVGRRGIHLQQLENLNELPAGTIQANPNVQPDALRRYKGFASIIEQADHGSSNYNALQVNLKRRMSHNILFGVAYTWSKLLDFGSSRGYELPDITNPNLDYGPADFDMRDVFVADYVWNLPYLDHSENWFLRNGFGDWQLSGVTQMQTGEPFSTSNGDDYAGVGPGAGTQLWALARKPVVRKRFGKGYWFEPADYSAPAQGTFAPRGSRNAIYGPGFRSWNIALQKSFHVIPGHANQQLTFRADAFNFTNHPNLDTPDTTPGTSNFGQVTTKGQTYSSNREMQFTLRYAF